MAWQLTRHVTFRSNHVPSKKMIYHSLVESHLNYAIVAWGSHFARNILGTFDTDHIPEVLKQLSYTQNKVIRAIFRKPKLNKSTKMYTSNSPLYKELEVLKINDLYYHNLASIAHDYFYDRDLPEKIAENFTKKSEINLSSETRNSQIDLYYKTPKLVSSYRKPSIASTMLWNTIPSEIRKISSKKKFRSKLKENFLTKY